jgi:hypothetical protein
LEDIKKPGVMNLWRVFGDRKAWRNALRESEAHIGLYSYWWCWWCELMTCTLGSRSPMFCRSIFPLSSSAESVFFLTLYYIYLPTWRHVREYGYLNIHFCQRFASHMLHFIRATICSNVRLVTMCQVLESLSISTRINLSNPRPLSFTSLRTYSLQWFSYVFRFFIPLLKFKHCH